MNVLNNSSDDVVECPLCMEPLEVDDLNFYPCTCGYQICRFCWHRIRTDENELCPACRKAYPENPADFTPLSQEQIAALKAEKRQRDQQRKQKITENRKHLANVRVVQKNLVFVVGLPPRLADAEILKKYEYFGKYGKIHKVVINPSTTYAGVQGPSASAYVTYVNNNDALRAIQYANNVPIDGRMIKTSLGTTKYCSHFMKNQQCPKADCMYLHELGDPEASFTKEEMHQGKHQEYEKRLHEALEKSNAAANCKNSDKLGSGPIEVKTKEAWPSLSVSPVNKEQVKTNEKNGIKENITKVDSRKHDKVKADKKGQKSNKLQTSSNNNSNHNNHNDNSDNKENSNSTNNANNQNGIKDTSTTIIEITTTNEKSQQLNNKFSNVDDEIKLIEDFEKDISSSEDNDGKNTDTRSISSSSSGSSNNGSDSVSISESSSGKSSPGSFPDHHLVSETSKDVDAHVSIENNKNSNMTSSSSSSNNSSISSTITQTSSKSSFNSNGETTNSSNTSLSIKGVESTNILDTTSYLSKLNLYDDSKSFFSSSSFQPSLLKGNLIGNDSRNQLNNTISSHLPDLLNGIDGYQTHQNNSSNSKINDNLINNTGKYLLSSLNSNEEWDTFKYALMKKHNEDQEEILRAQEMKKRYSMLNNMGFSQLNGLNDFNMNDYIQNGNDIKQAALFQQQQQQQQQTQTALFQQQQQQQQLRHLQNEMVENSLFGTNMSKFFDFHKQQQQQNQHQFVLNGHNNLINDHSMATLLENNRINSQYLDHTNSLIGQQLQKQRIFNNKYDQTGSHNQMLINNNSNQQQPPQQQNRIPKQYMQNTNVDDDLGFDPFMETQKGLAELIENEMVQQQTGTIQNGHNNKQFLENYQRTRMPPPGFNHMNAFGFGVPRPQGSKILSFMNNSQQQTAATVPQQQNNWPQQHLSGGNNNFQPTTQQLNDQIHQQQNGGGLHNNKTGYGNMSDWTAMDPAILSFRQFPNYSSHHQQQTQQQQPHADNMYMQHLTQQQSGTGFGHHVIPNNIMNQQQNSPAQVNYSNWFNSEQNMYMNSVTNGFSNNYDKFSIPMPPGIHSNNCMSGNRQQKSECIN